MEHQMLIVVLDIELPTQVLADQIEQIRRMHGVLGVRTLENIEAYAIRNERGGGRRENNEGDVVSPDSNKPSNNQAGVG